VDGRLTSTTGAKDIPSNCTVSLSPASSDVADLLGVWGVMERMKPWVHCGMRGKSRNCVGYMVRWAGLCCMYVDSLYVWAYDFA
jgi:hypothetical protein